MRHKNTGVGYKKDELLEEGSVPEPASSAPETGKNLYDNPLFDEEQVKVDLAKMDLGDDSEGNVPPGLTTYEANPPLYADLEEPEEDEKHVQKLNKYERF